MKMIRFRLERQDYLVSESKAKNPRVQRLLKKSFVYGLRPFVTKPKRVRRKIVKKPKKVAKPIRVSRRKLLRKPRRKVVRRGLSGVEMMQLKKIPKKRGIFDFDVEAHIDRTVDYWENVRLLENVVGTKLRFGGVVKMPEMKSFDIRKKEKKLLEHWKGREYEYFR